MITPYHQPKFVYRDVSDRPTVHLVLSVLIIVQLDETFFVPHVHVEHVNTKLCQVKYCSAHEVCDVPPV